MARGIVRIGATLVVALWATAAGAADGYTHKVPEGFKPLDKVLALAPGAAATNGPATIDLGWGATSGQFKDVDCAAVCAQGRRFDFNYVVNGDGSLQIEYTGGQICGTPSKPKGGRQPFTCNGSDLKFGNDYRKASDAFTGSP
jgi:hypothetical protein